VKETDSSAAAQCRPSPTRLHCCAANKRKKKTVAAVRRKGFGESMIQGVKGFVD